MPDLLIVGGGPAGLATALYARRAGFGATVLEARADPVDKACGEGLMPGAVRALRELSVELVGAPLAGIAYLDAADPDRVVRAAFRRGPGLGVRRTALSAALRAAAAQAGATLVTARAERPEHLADGVRCGRHRADYLVAADGLHSPVRRAVGLHVEGRSSRRYGLRQHFALAPWTDHVEVHWAPDAEAYVTPLAPDLVGVAILSQRGRSFDQRLAGFPALRARLAGAEAGPVHGAGPLRQRARRRVHGRVLLVGDAAGYIDALTGEGIAVSLSAARALIDCLGDGRPQAYESAWRQVTRRPRALTAALLATSRSPLRPLIVPTARRAPWAFAAAVDQLAG